ncbi:MAG: PTS glucose transporter subunit IIA [Lachnospiraceae bacterium]|nr:PTS glucose transporter subunit IIA [Eubacterium sp.]MBQ3933428.1 PTS glucose transporter subunit IIA [Lachnospiraceae bacterium]
MALDYSKCAKEIYENLGGRENIVQAAHCATRLRLVIADNTKINKKVLEDIDGVKGMFESNGQLQLIIGTGTVNKVYDELLKVSGMTAATKDDVKAAAASKAPAWKRALKSIGDVFVPILPAIVASGLMMGIVEALGKAIPAFQGSAWFSFLDMIANTAFAFLPVIVAISAARVFGGNIFLGAVIGLMMVHGALLNGWNVASIENIYKFFMIPINGMNPYVYEAQQLAANPAWSWANSGLTIPAIPGWDLFGTIKIGGYTLGSIARHGYQGHVIPVIIAVWLMCKIEKWLHKHVPEMVDLFVVPLVTVFVTALATFVVIGPVFANLETWVLEGARWLVQLPVGATLMGALYPLTVVMGLHHMYNVIESGMLASGGLNTWMPIATAANFAQFGACLAVGIKAKKMKTKTVAVPSSLSAALGITEPAIFGVNFRFMNPFLCAMAGGALGAAFGAVVKLGATAYGVTGIPGYLTINNYGLYTLLLLISGGAAFVLTWIFWKEDKDESDENGNEKVKEDKKEIVETAEEKEEVSEEGVAYIPVKGKAISYEEIPDETFAAGILGQGIGVVPKEGAVYAPFDGEISSVAETGHAIGITGNKDMELLIHVGIDTVKMNGDGFLVKVKDGDKVVKGQLLMTFDIEKIKAAGFDTTTAVLLTNSDDYPDFKILGIGDVEVGNKMFEI